ncbi:MAG: hypothetical protein NZ700_10440 [Gemmataceae bacterium]|nr:hypothetical protein [Gemmataceae bacterium]
MMMDANLSRVLERFLNVLERLLEHSDRQEMVNLLERLVRALEGAVGPPQPGQGLGPAAPSLPAGGEGSGSSSPSAQEVTLDGRVPPGVCGRSDQPVLSARDSAPVGRLVEFLNQRNIRIKNLPRLNGIDETIDRLALFLGERYEALSSLLSKIKRAMQRGLPISEDLAGRRPEDINSVCQFCTLLHEFAFLEEYHYLRAPRCVIHAKTTTLPMAQRFFGGQWLERYVLQKIRGAHAQVAREVAGELAFEFLINPQIELPNGADFELDVLALIGSSVYWVEAKTAEFQQHVLKYSKFARFLRLDEDHAFLVVADLAENRCRTLSDLFSMSVCNLRMFENRFLAVARSDSAGGNPFL